LAKKEFFKLIDEDGKERLRIRIETIKGEVTLVVVQYETYYEEKWIPNS
jgi:uncharacterized protein YrzB (UPF0473 family)